MNQLFSYWCNQQVKLIFLKPLIQECNTHFFIFIFIYLFIQLFVYLFIYLFIYLFLKCVNRPFGTFWEWFSSRQLNFKELSKTSYTLINHFDSQGQMCSSIDLETNITLRQPHLKIKTKNKIPVIWNTFLISMDRSLKRPRV